MSSAWIKQLEKCCHRPFEPAAVTGKLNITKDPSAILELQKFGFMTTPVTVVDDKVIVGFDVPKLDAALKG